MAAGLYIHIPFCRSRCIYCDFYSTTRLARIEPFLAALHREIGLSNDSFWHNQHFATLYLGGGTPSLLSPEHISTLLSVLFDTFTFDSNVEISMEANPGALFMQNVPGYKKAGVNRLTIGVQSFEDNELKFLQRIHSSADALAALRAARRAAFDSLGMDLIFGIPGQSLASWQHTLATAVRERPEHISLYGLTYEQSTPLWSRYERGEVSKCEEELEREMFLAGIGLLKEAGYEHYEISNFALPGFRSKHNQKYWDSSPFLGLGPSAHSFDGVKRWWNVDDLTVYTKILFDGERPIEDEEDLGLLERIEELVLLGLRRKEGMSLVEWEELTGVVAAQFIDLLQHRFGAVDRGEGFFFSPAANVLTHYKNRLCLTQQGLLLYNTICENIFSLVNKELVNDWRDRKNKF
ncbi:radical SAM family heme chaperone HemW [candidate division KSB1 bacterium]|nr:radical SAM family heme chaperone HemW [candidate division KSB1 bacterium]RQW05669.1 MAG: radical SAM family heme chaperone HemW [candidate division KSB1 bacterium]